MLLVPALVHTTPCQVCTHEVVHVCLQTQVVVSCKPLLPEHQGGTRSEHLADVDSIPWTQQWTKQGGW